MTSLVSMVRRELSIPVRHGKSITHVASIEDAAQLMTILCAPRPLHGTGNLPGVKGEDSSLLVEVCQAADVLLALIPAWASLDGAATKNLGTALRASKVRDHLSHELTSAKLPLPKEL